MLNRKIVRLYLVPILLALFIFTVSVLAVRNKTNTTDEGSHMVRGIMLLKTGDYRLNQHHPILFNTLNAIPAVLNPNLITESLESENWQQAKKDEMAFELVNLNGGILNFSKEILFPSRVSMALFTALFLVLLYYLFYKEYGFAIAAISITLLALSPTLIAHGSLVTTDAPAMFTIFLGTWFLYKYLKKPSKKTLWIFILASLSALLAKFTAVFATAIWLIAIFIYPFAKNGWKFSWNVIKPFLTVSAAWIVLLWAAYGFQLKTIHEVEYGNVSANEATLNHLSHLDDSFPIEISPTLTSLYYNVKLPFPQYIKGFYDNVFKHNYYGHGSFLLGEFSEKGWWYYFPVAFAVKENIVFVLLTVAALMSGIIILSKNIKNRLLKITPELVLIAVPLFLLVLNLQSSINLGVRHLLPIYPFLALLISLKIVPFLRKSLNTRRAFVIAILAMVASVLSQFPNYIEYFNEASGGPQNGYKILRDSNFDWDQNNGAVLEYIRATPNSTDNPVNVTVGELLVVRVESLFDRPDVRSSEMEKIYKDYN